MSSSTTGITITSHQGDDNGRIDVEVTVAGDFDATQVGAFEQALEAVEPTATVTIDISDCTILDSSSLGSLVRFRHRLDESGGTLRTRANKPYQRQILNDTALADYLGLLQ